MAKPRHTDACGHERATPAAKRAFDVLCVLLAAPAWVPLMLALAAAVLLLEGWPVFFVQQRAGKGGRPFHLLKFRTMRIGEGPDGERLTRFGRLMRATSLDELPELLMVLFGRMSLVGPRPLPMRYLPRYSPEQARRHNVLPGITGWAQVHGRNNVPWTERFRLDVWYVDNWSFALDLKILFQTIFTVLGAHDVNAEGADTMEEFRGNGGASQPTR